MKYALLLFWLLWPLGAWAQGGVSGWQLDAAHSSIRFSVAIEGSPATGEFTSFAAHLLFDPEKLEECRIEVTIDLNHIEAAYRDVAENLKHKDWFDVAHYPGARFTSQHFKYLGNRQYQASGNLTLRNVTRPETLYFTLTEYNGTHARITGRMEIDRRDFGVGQGGWRAVSSVAGKVFLKVVLSATRK